MVNQEDRYEEAKKAYICKDKQNFFDLSKSCFDRRKATPPRPIPRVQNFLKYYPSIELLKTYIKT
jgi:hypothetical protein